MTKKKKPVLQYDEPVDETPLPLPLKTCSWNIMTSNFRTEGDTDHVKRNEGIIDLLDQQDCDLIFLQEVDELFLNVLNAHSIVTDKNYHVYVTESLDPYGQAVLSRPELSSRGYFRNKGGEKQFLMVEASNVQFFNVHLIATDEQRKQRQGQIRDLVKYCVDEGRTAVICGDLNFATEDEVIEGWKELCPPNKRKATYDVNNPMTITEESYRFDRFYCSDDSLVAEEYSLEEERVKQ
ncbi:hypothetical protein PROFUN_03770 [Planoprotostelium fungivorum]|uniref:Endonuclease/exonuclease/phosphatase domain-containing protein n=1 Tax=Planoprotostelium fungivorum TaxID=1890364 RepID=A0A2P6NDR1_9EUKA|nr:hypothetical protein PROFUN_03770 [Planoprotostelium fungivorum]